MQSGAMRRSGAHDECRHTAERSGHRRGVEPGSRPLNRQLQDQKLLGLINVKGHFTGVSGDGQVTGKGAIFGRLDIQVASLHTGIGKRDEHLRSADFFDAVRYPDISVVVTAVEPATGNDAALRTTFSIKGVTA